MNIKNIKNITSLKNLQNMYFINVFIYLCIYCPLLDWVDRQHLLHNGHHGGEVPDCLPPVLQALARVVGKVLRHTHLLLLFPLQHSKVLRAYDRLHDRSKFNSQRDKCDC